MIAAAVLIYKQVLKTDKISQNIDFRTLMSGNNQYFKSYCANEGLVQFLVFLVFWPTWCGLHTFKLNTVHS